MATVTNAGEILTLTTLSEDQRDERHDSISSAHKTYVPYIRDQKNPTFGVERAYKGTEGENDDGTGPAVISVESLPSESDDSDYDDFFDDIVDGGVDDSSSVDESNLASPIAKSDGASELSKTTPIHFHKPSIISSISPKKSEEGSGVSETTPIKIQDPKAVNIHKPIRNHSICPKKSEEGSGLSETTLINIHEPIGNHSISPTQSEEGSVLSETTPINLHKTTSICSISPKKSTEGSELSETAPINFREPIGNHSISPKKSEEGNALSKTTHINLHEPIGNHCICPKKSEEGGELSKTTPINPHKPTGNHSISPKKSEEGSVLSETTPINLYEPTSICSISPKKSTEGSELSETTPINFREPGVRSLSTKKGDDLSVLSETTPINCHEPTSIRNFAPISPLSSKGSKKNDDFSVLSDTTPINFHEPTSVRNLSDNKSDDMSVLSDTTPINFREPSVRSLIAKNDEGSVLSDTTPMKFYESSTQFGIVDDGSDDDESDDSPFEVGQSKRSIFGGSKRSGMSAAEKKASQRFETELRNLGMTAAQKKASQRFDSELFDQGMDLDAEREIVNVYLEATAFADKERLNLTEDIYSFILACSFGSFQFWVAIYFICVKYLCFFVVLVNLGKIGYKGEVIQPGALLTKFVMIPVSVAMQEDLITVYYNVANKKYDALTHKRNIHATETKWILCNLLRAIDGILSMVVNFLVMLYGTDVMGIFSNFAALHFLQFIDDVIYELAEKGFFGHAMEQATIACKVITFTRRTTTGNSFNNFVINLDTILLCASAILCFLIYLTVIVTFYKDTENREGYSSRNFDTDSP